MSVSVAEYYGQRTDAEGIIKPIQIPRTADGKADWVDEAAIPCCPFTEGNCCKKLKSGKEPVCSVRNKEGVLWVACSERVCSTKKGKALSAHQIDMLKEIADCIFPSDLDKENIFVKREVPLKATKRTNYRADFVITTDKENLRTSGPNSFVLEVQGGGETSNTGRITAKVHDWKKQKEPANYMLMELASASPLVTNAWRRQQEQFLVKGSIASKTQSGLGLVFCVGTLLFDYLMDHLGAAKPGDLKDGNWTLALIAVQEDKSKPVADGPIPLKVDPDRTLYTSYQSFVHALIDRGENSPDVLKGDFINLKNKTKHLK